MVFVRIVGGLGNQMFQYAAGRALADRLDVELRLDLRDFERYRLHGYGLYRFCLSARQATEGELLEIGNWRRRFGLIRAKLGLGGQYYAEPSFSYDPRWPTLVDGVHLNGYFQSERYFSEYASRLRADFVPVEPLSGNNLRIAELAATCNSIALHVRRGDYVTNSKTMSIHGVCSPEYYRKGISMMRERFEDCRFFVFSNDMDWAREKLDFGADAVFVVGNDREPEVDIHLMASCRHHIIANSSFSWWGAWLGRNPDQCVIAPTPWFDSSRLRDTDLVPRDWLRVEKV